MAKMPKNLRKALSADDMRQMHRYFRTYGRKQFIIYSKDQYGLFLRQIVDFKESMNTVHIEVA